MPGIRALIDIVAGSVGIIRTMTTVTLEVWSRRLKEGGTQAKTMITVTVVVWGGILKEGPRRLSNQNQNHDHGHGRGLVRTVVAVMVLVWVAPSLRRRPQTSLVTIVLVLVRRPSSVRPPQTSTVVMVIVGDPLSSRRWSQTLAVTKAMV